MSDDHSSKKRRRLTLEMKLDIIKRCERGENPSKLGRLLDLNRSTIFTILKDKERILEYVKGCVSMQSTIITKKRISAMGKMANSDVPAESKKAKLNLRNPPLTSKVEERNPFQYSYSSHPSKLSEPSTTSTQPTFEDSTLSLFLSETRMQNAEMRVAMGQLTDKMDNIMNKVNQLSQYQCRKRWQTPTAFQEDHGDKGDDWSGDENCHKITKVKLLARIISMEEKCEILVKENVSLKKDLQNTTAKLVDFETDQFGRISESVKTAMNTVYSEIETKFLDGIEYEGSGIRNIVASTIKELTEELDGETLEENIELDSSKKMKLGKSSTVGKRKRKPKVKDKPASSTKVSQKDSETVDVATVASTNPMEIEVAAENTKSDPGGSWRETFQKPSDFLESTMILQGGEVITIKEENCSIASREGSEERVIAPEPPSPPILDAGELSESGEEWLPS